MFSSNANAKQEQLSFVFDLGTPEVMPDLLRTGVPSRAPIADQFAAFHELNPHVYLALCSLARHVRSEHGMPRTSMKWLFETIRGRHKLATQGDRWLLNNSYTAEYARLVMDQEPDLADFFETRELKRRK